MVPPDGGPITSSITTIPWTQGLKEIGIGQVEYVAGLTATDRHLPAIVEAIAPHGRLALIDDPRIFDIVSLKRKSVSVHWELMFTPHAVPDT